MSDQKKRTGRPPKRIEPGNRVSLGLKVTGEIKEKIDTAAQRTGRTQSQEAERRIEHSFQVEESSHGLLTEALQISFGSEIGALLLLMGNAMRDVAAIAGYNRQKRLLEDQAVFDEAAASVAEIVAAFRPVAPSAPIRAEFSGIGEKFARGLLEATKNKERGGDIATRVEPIRQLLGAAAKRIQVDDSEVWVPALESAGVVAVAKLTKAPKK